MYIDDCCFADQACASCDRQNLVQTSAHCLADQLNRTCWVYLAGPQGKAAQEEVLQAAEKAGSSIFTAPGGPRR